MSSGADGGSSSSGATPRRRSKKSEAASAGHNTRNPIENDPTPYFPMSRVLPLPLPVLMLPPLLLILCLVVVMLPPSAMMSASLAVQSLRSKATSSHLSRVHAEASAK